MKVSVVIPVYNSADIQNELYRRLTDVLEKNYPSHEIIFVNDGSEDNSTQVLKEICRKDDCVRLIDFSRNFGHQAAISAGLPRAQGDLIAVMDDDLQDPPEILPAFIDKIAEGYDVVYGVRKRRKESLLKRLSYHFFYRLLGALSHDQIQIDAGDFCVMRRKIVDAINLFPESNKFLRGIRSSVGFKQVGLEYERDPRRAGKSQYTFKKYVRFALDALFSFSYLPLRIATLLGVAAAFLSFVYGIFIVFKKLFGYIDHVPGFASLFVLTAFLGGMILVSLGIIGEYIARVYDEAKKRPLYIIREEVNFDRK
jgi:dolichol-phosphate mannosyltransferase